MPIKLLQICFASFFDLYKDYNICLISFLSFSELFPEFNWAKAIGNLLSIWFGVTIFKPFPCWFCLLNSRIFFNNIYYFICFFNYNLIIRHLFNFICKSFNPLLIILTNTLFLFLSFKLYIVSNISVGIWKLKYFLNNSMFMFLFFKEISLISLL